MSGDGPGRPQHLGGLAGPGVRILLAGTGTHRAGSALPDVAAVATSLAEVGRVLTGECGADPAHLRVLTDPADPVTLGAALAEAAGQATDVLLLYYIGHGLVSADGELHLATMATDDPGRGLAYKALPFAAVRDAVADCRARAIVIVLDCCFAGRAARSARPLMTGSRRPRSGALTCWPPPRTTSRRSPRPETGGPRSRLRWWTCCARAIRAGRAGSPWGTSTGPWPGRCPRAVCPGRGAP